jgi:tetratricopeptide (TPR) repeat protein
MRDQIIIILIFIFGCLPAHASIIYRNWTDKEGRIVEARLIHYQNGQATIERADGRKFTFASSVLSEVDQEYIMEWLEEQARQQQASGVEVYDLSNPLLKDPLTVERRKETGNNMLIYASSLGRERDLVVVKERGLYIKGTTLSGSGVQRPQVYVRRAAELLAEEGLDKQDAQLIGDALHQFYSSLRDYNTPVGYLRRGAVQYRESHPEFAIYCEVELAHCYRMQGDHVSAFSILEKYRGRTPDNEMLGRALASYAQALLEHGYFDEALKIAQEVRDKCP